MMKNKKNLIFIFIFILLGIIFSQIFISPIVGAAGQSFTPFEFIGPTAGLFLGSIPGALAVLSVRLANFLIAGENFSLLAVIRLFPLVLAAIYFGLSRSKKYSRLILLVPILAIILFVLHPQGRLAWAYSLYWLIPIICFFRKDRLALNSLGSTFTAHSVGSVAFLYAFNLPAEIWLGLIPVVLIERFCFAMGIWASYLFLNSLLNVLAARKSLAFLSVLVKPQYVFSRKFFKMNS